MCSICEIGQPPLQVGSSAIEEVSDEFLGSSMPGPAGRLCVPEPSHKSQRVTAPEQDAVAPRRGNGWGHTCARRVRVRPG